MQAQIQKMGDRATIRLNGRFDFNAHRHFREAYESQLGSGDVKQVEIDFGQVDYVDSSALGMLLMLKEKAQASSKAVVLLNCKGTVKQVLDIANFGKLFEMR
ncbi:MAG: STAS domain-containing protein [Betaproteobacteria bacterium]|jgi:anti-anti-sigma factor